MGVLMLASYGYAGGAIGDFLNSLAQEGFFSYLLPFLLIFALVFGILKRTKIFEKNAINGIIALGIGLMALQFDFVPRFFAEIFPRLGVALAVILVVLILAGLFIDPNEKGLMWGMVGIVGIILVIVLVQTAGALGWSSGYWWQENWPFIAGVVFILVVVAIIVASDTESKKSESVLAKALRGAVKD